VMLVVGAGLLVRSFQNLTTVDAGFDARKLIDFGIALPQATYTDPRRRAQFVVDLKSKLAAIPGVERAAAMTGLPPMRDVNANDTDFEGMTNGPGKPQLNVDYYQTATIGYFETMRIPIVKGRGFEPSDAGGPGVTVINESLAKIFYPKGDAIGKRMRPCCSSPTDQVPWLTIVGIAKDVKQGGLDQKVGTEMYFAVEQGVQTPFSYNFVVRTGQPVGAVAPAIRAVVRSMDPGLPIIQMRSMTDIFADSVTRQRFLSQLLEIFAGVALLLAAIGTYGVVSYLVTERQREIGIRVALGAGTGRIVRLVLQQGLTLATVGILVGVAGALVLARLTRSLLFGVSPNDPTTYLGVAAVIAVVALLACLLPARRAMGVDPLEAIRGE
jgi:putative ABC transport system permease protein